MKKADNFDAKQWLVENKITTQSRLNEEERTSGNILIQNLTPEIKEKIKFIKDNYPNLSFKLVPNNNYHDDEFLKGTYTFSYGGPADEEMQDLINDLNS
jgi:hypothetical protein